MYTPLSLCLGDTLYTMYPTLILEYTIDSITRDGEDNFLVSSCGTLTHTSYLGSPSSSLAVADIHAIEVSCEEGCFVTTCPASYLHHDILGILRVCRDEQELDLLLERGDALLGLLHHLLGHCA